MLEVIVEDDVSVIDVAAEPVVETPKIGELDVENPGGNTTDAMMATAEISGVEVLELEVLSDEFLEVGVLDAGSLDGEVNDAVVVN